jgi:sulfur carrier protein
VSIGVWANGKPYEIAADTTVARFIGDRELDPRYVVVELNGVPLARAKYGERTLEDGDRLELVRAVAGG